jgi:PKD repeat protein
MTLTRTLLALAILLCLMAAPAAAAGEYDHIFQNTSLTPEEKLNQFTQAIGWTPELEAAAGELAEWQMSQKEAPEEEPNPIMRFVRTLSAQIVSQAEEPETGYTEEDAAATQEQLAAYYDAYSENIQPLASVQASGGSGTAADPYLVATATDLYNVRNNLAAHYRQTAHIDLSGYANWAPIGASNAPFTGVYNGDGYKITGMTIDSTSDHVGLFAALAGTVQNVVLDGAVTSTNANCALLAGQVIGNVDAVIDSVRISGSLHTTGGGSGAITAKLSDRSTLSNSYVIADVTSSEHSALAVGWSGGNSVYIRQVYTQGTVINSAGPTGSIVAGAAPNTAISNTVALSSAISGGTGDSIGRVLTYYQGTRSNNYAAAEMLVNGAPISGGSTTNKDGAPVASATYHTQTFWQNTAGYDFSTTWEMDPTTNLPRLQVEKLEPVISSVSVTPASGYAPLEVQLTASASNDPTYVWQISTDQSSWSQIAAGASATYTITTTGTKYIRVIATNSAGNVTSDTKTVTVSAPPVPVFSSSSATPNAGYTPLQVTLTASATNSPTYKWQISTDQSTWTQIATTASATYTLTTPDTYYFRAIATNQYGTATSSTKTVTASAPPMPDITSASVTPTSGYSPLQVTLSATATNTTSYQWQVSGDQNTWADIATSASATYTIQSLGPRYFRVVASNQYGSDTSAVQTVTVNAPPVPVFQSATATPSSGYAPLQITLAASASNDPTYVWQISTDQNTWTQIATTALATYTISTTDTYYLRSVATNQYGTATSAVQSVIVSDPPVPEITSATASPATGYAPLTIALAGSATNSPTYSWEVSADQTSWTQVAVAASATYNADTTGTYYFRLTATNQYGTATSAVQSVVVSDPPVPEITSATASPESGYYPMTVTLTGTATNSPSYLWRISTDGTSWSQIATTANTTHLIQSAGTYHFQLTAANQYGSTTSDDLEVVAEDPPVPVFQSVSVLPSAGNPQMVVTMTASATNSPTYSWETSSDQTEWTQVATGSPATYTIEDAGTHYFRAIATNQYGTATSAVQSVDVSELPIPIISGLTVSPATGYAPLEVQLTSNVSNDPSYSWQITQDTTGNWMEVATTANASTTIPTIGIWYIRLVAANEYGTATSAARTVIVDPPPVPVYQISTALPATGYAPLEVTLTAYATNSPSYVWQASADQTTWSQIAATANTTYTLDTTGTYYLRGIATNQYGFATSAVQTVVVSDPPVPEITSATASPPSGYVPLDVQLTASATNSPAYTWQISTDQSTWTQVGTGSPLSYTVGTTGTYYFRVVASNQYGTDTSEAITVVTTPPPIPVITYASVTPTSGYPVLPVTLTASATNNPDYTWQISTDQSTWNYVADTAIASFTFQLPGTYYFRVVASNQYGSDVSATTTVTVLDPPVPVFQSVSASPATGYAPQQVQLSATATNSPSYSWQISSDLNTWTQVATGSSARYTVSVPNTYYFRVVATNQYGSATSEIRMITIYAPGMAPSIEITSPTNTQTYQRGETIQLSASVSGTQPITTQWIYSGASGGNPAALNTQISYPDAGRQTITLTASNVHGTTSKTITIYVSAKPARPIYTGGPLTPPDDQLFYNLTDSLGGSASGPDLIAFALTAITPYTDQIGLFFWLYLYAVFYLILWIRQRNAITPAILGLLLGPFMLPFVPAAYTLPAVIICVLALTGGIIAIYTSRPKQP